MNHENPAVSASGESLDEPAAMEKLDEVRSLVVNSIAQTMDHYGVSATTALLYGLMYFHDDPITLDEMCTKMGMSKGSMSTGVRKLLENRMVHRTFRPGERKDLYRAEEDFYKNFINFFCRKWEDEITINMKAIEEAQAAYDDLLQSYELPLSVRRRIEKDRTKIEESKEYYWFLERLIDRCESGELLRWLSEDTDSERRRRQGRGR
ncbi:GbsR/MarR family transcriptional regulator [Natronospirillum operosum]|uniref:HTH-type transcriptional regulator n=1 Tax=Natronospirillum operosum TaxID=2759953 RepID=A0A4Z0WHC0_9GAMM|nr:GbsR/MarR family transcriptional regulator [Natronospirillum operosum]TGG93980.1 GbsR/MarR family transcriptional regulator [Natronospirillum operosum]